MTKPDLRFLIDIAQSKIDHKDLDIKITPVVIIDGKIRNPTFSLDDSGAGEYEGFQVHGYAAPSDEDFHFGNLAFTDIHIDLRRAEAMVKTLRRLEKKLAAIRDKLGAPADSASHLAYVAQAAGCDTRHCFGRLASKAFGWSYDDHEYRWMDVDALRYHINNKIQEHRS